MGASIGARTGRKRTFGLFGWSVRAIFGILGLGCIIGGGAELQSHALYSLYGRSVDAKLLDRRQLCNLEYQLANESDLRREPMDCAAAEASVKANPGRLVRVNREESILVRYPLPNGGTRDATTRLGFGNRLSESVAPGAVVPILVVSDNANDFRVALTVSRMTENIMLLVVGILVLSFTIMGSINRSPRLYRVGKTQEVANAMATQRKPA